MTAAKEMTPEDLAAVREMGDAFRTHYAGGLSMVEVRAEDWADLLAHIDALTADRDEARQEVRALRAQRDEIREAHRVEVAALAARLEAAERLAVQACSLAEVTGQPLVVSRDADAAEAKLAALVEAVPVGTTVLCVAMVDACTSCERTFEEPIAEDKCPSCGAEWCMTTYVGDPTYRVTHAELGDPKCLDAALRAARGEP